MSWCSHVPREVHAHEVLRVQTEPTSKHKFTTLPYSQIHQWVHTHWQITYVEGLGMSPCIMRLTTQDSYILKEHIELYKILKFRVNWANTEQNTAIQKLQNLLRNVWISGKVSGDPYIFSFWMAVCCSILSQLTRSLRILWSSVCSFRIYRSCVANPILNGLIPRLSRYETWQWNHSSFEHAAVIQTRTHFIGY